MALLLNTAPPTGAELRRGVAMALCALSLRT
jgi:hypothetical protein